MTPTPQTPPFGLRPGEVATELPAAFDAGLYFIGRIRTPWTRREDCPRNGAASDAECVLEIDARWTAGLDRIDERSHLWALYFMHHSPRDVMLQIPRRGGGARGVFTLRSPARPNPIAMSVVRLLRVERDGAGGACLIVVGLDCLDGTPLLDVKPWSPADAAPLAEGATRTDPAHA